MLRNLVFLIVFWCLYFSVLPVKSQVIDQADGLPMPSSPPRLVNDYVNLLTAEQLHYLERKLVAFDDSTGTQIAVVIVSDLGGRDKADFTISLGKKWAVGGEKNNGVVIMVKPVAQAGEKRKSFIAVGKGLEGVIPDITAKRIETNEMIPAFKQGQYFEGLNKATDIIMGLANKDFAAADYEKKSKGNSGIAVAVVVFLVILILASLKRKASHHSIGGGDIPFLTAMMMMMNTRHSGRYNDFNSGGGDFGGFGGGDFGGGGAGGEW